MRRPSKAPRTELMADWHSGRLISSSGLRSGVDIELAEDCRESADSSSSHSCTRLRKASPLLANSLQGP